MSWSVGLAEPAAAEDFDAAIDALEPPHELTQEGRAQLVAAREAAKALVHGGSIGDDGKRFYATLNGHANPGHEPAPGYANDLVSVSVRQADPVASS